MVVISKLVVPKGYVGLTVFPFIFLKFPHLKADEVLLNHERIHLRQQLELLILPFYLIYALEFLLRFCYYRNWKMAYQNISFEREAYRNENQMHYLTSKRFWSFLSYL
ncbi:MAG: hypothetical protein AAF688_05475 [Bacteroidota bacterium]